MEDLRRFLREDIGNGDITTDVFVPDIPGSASIVCESHATVAGLEEAAEIFRLLGVDAVPLIGDGDVADPDTAVMSLHGPLKGIITGERTALNFIMRMSGIATATRSIVERTKPINPNLRISATRKTTPGFRYFEKKAVSLGGGWPHRMGLYDMVMVKDNHIVACGGIDKVIERMPSVPAGVMTEIEVVDIDEGLVAAGSGADIIMADHLTPDDTRKLRDSARRINPNILIEASGNITADNVCEYAECADIISLGALTHSVVSIHFSLDID